MNPTPTAAEAMKPDHEKARAWAKTSLDPLHGPDCDDCNLARAYLSLPAPGAPTAAERAGWGKVRAELCNGDWRVIDKRGWAITQGVSKHIAETIADALNAPAATPVAGLFEALEKLAKLGNEPLYGNSDGNCIARLALQGFDGMLRVYGDMLPMRPLPVPAPTAGGEGGE